MKFIVSSATLLKKLQLISGVISTNTVLPILEDFLFEIDGGELTIYATDLEISMSTKVDIESKENGKVAIPAKMLLDILKMLPEQPVTFSVNAENYAIELTTDNGKYKLAGENPEDFPKLPQAGDTQSFNMPSEVLTNAISKCLFAVSNDELRPAMTGILFELSPSELTFVSTDGHKLVQYNRKDVNVQDNAKFIMPKKALNLLKTALPAEVTNVSLAYDDTNAFLTFQDVYLSTRLIDARFPDYGAVIPKDNPYTLTIDRNFFQNAVRRTSIFSNKMTNQVVLSLAGSQLQLSAQDLDYSNEASEKLSCEYEGEDLKIGFNAKFLNEMLGVMDGQEVKMRLSTPTRAGLLVPAEASENEDLLILVMPISLNV